MSTTLISGVSSTTTTTVSGTVTANAGTNLNTSLLALETTQVAEGVLVGAVTETAPASDTASSGLNGRLQRIAQRLTSLIALLPAALGAGGGLKVDGSGTSLPVSGTVAVTQATGTNLHAVLDSGTLSTITNVVHVDDNAGSLTVDGTLAVTNAGLSNIDVLLSTRTKPADQQHAIVDSGTITAVTAITNALPAGTNVIGHVIADTGSTTAVTGNVTVVQATGTNLHAVVDSGTITAVTALTNPVSTKTDLTPSSPTAVSVGVTSAQAVASSATRKGLVLVNTSTARISLGFGATAVLDSGITLYPQGSFCMDEYSFDLGAVNAIASAAASNLAIQEFTT